MSKTKKKNEASIRSCKSCGNKDFKENLVRFVIKDEAVYLDLRQKINLKSFYSCFNNECLKLVPKFINKSGLKMDFEADRSFELVRNFKYEELLSALALCRRVGSYSLGRDETKSSLQANDLEVIIITKDCGDSARKDINLDKKDDRVAVFEFFEKNILGKIFERNELAILGLKKHPVNNRIVSLLEALMKAEKPDNLNSGETLVN